MKYKIMADTAGDIVANLAVIQKRMLQAVKERNPVSFYFLDLAAVLNLEQYTFYVVLLIEQTKLFYVSPVRCV